MLLVRNKMRRASPLPAVLCLIALAGASYNAARAEGPQIAARPLIPQEIADLGLPEDTVPSNGLFTVGVGDPVYLEAQVPTGTVISAVTWTITKKPVGSNAVLAESPIPVDFPIYSPGDRGVSIVAGRKLLFPDTVGHFTIQAVVATPDGPITEVHDVTAATYLGNGFVSNPASPVAQCVFCHKNRVEAWSKTGHATMFTEAIDGLKSAHYNKDCISCHTVGYNPSPGAVNGGFDDVANQVGWVFPAELKIGNWDAMPTALKAVSNIQCENCHGPGSEHVASDDRKANISISFSAGDCARCHGEAPYHTIGIEWSKSLHAAVTRSPTGESRDACVRCHSGIGFVDTVKGKNPVRTDYEAITCAACHDPHDATNPHQLRKVDGIALMDGTEITTGGNGRICMNCHTARVEAKSYATEYHSHFGPHHGPQTDMLMGTNAIDYGKKIPSSGHKYAVPDTCATCHMQATAMDDPVHGLAGGHTFKVDYRPSGEDMPGEDVDLVGACAQCHGPITSFDFGRADYDGDGVIDGVQTEVKHLLDKLGTLLPPMNDVSVNVTADYTPAQLKAAFNYQFVLEDGSMGVHNTAYAVGLLRASIADLGGTGGPVINPDDTDNDGLSDSWEIANFGSIQAQNGEGDADGDGLTNAFEMRAGTNPNLADSDGDGFNDLAEIHASKDPLNKDDNPEVGSKIYPAAEFVFYSQVGKKYQIESIEDLGTGTWTTISDTIEGTGDMIQMFISTREHSNEFFRVVEIKP